MFGTLKKEEYYFSVVDVVSALTDSKEPRKYWSVLKNRLKKEGSELTTKCSQLKMLAPDGKMRLRDTLDTKGILRLIESIPSPNAEPFKIWLAKMGGHTAKVAREDIEKSLGESVATSKNALDYKYLDDKKLIDDKKSRKKK